jgi:hypothetical protein
MENGEDQKYEEEYFSHWLAMYNVHQDDWIKESIEEQIDLYKTIEGAEEYERLKEEVRQIVRNNDLAMFLDETRKEVTLPNLELMASTIARENCLLWRAFNEV